MLSRVQALNYRCLRYIDLPLLPFQVLIGPNASGKSSFLDVVNLLGDYVQFGLDDALLRTYQNPNGRATSLEQLIFNQASSSFELALELKIPENLASKHKYTRYEVKFGQQENGEMMIAAENLWLYSEELPYSPVVDPKTILVAPGNQRKPNQNWHKVVSKNPGSGNDYYKAESTDWNITFKVGARKSSLGGLMQDVEKFPVSLWVQNLLREGIHILALNSIAMRRPCSPSETRNFKVDGSNLPLVVQDLKRKNPEFLQAWLEHIQTVLPDVETILVQERTEDKHLYLGIKYYSGDNCVPSWLLSDGTLRMLALTLLAYLPTHSGIYLIEEPENGIHPQAIEAVFQSLSSVYDSQIILATHSPLLLSLAKKEQILCFSKNDSGATEIIPGNKHPALENWQNQISLSTLYAGGVLG
ncbi:MAG: AAA family ATPase [Gomphosphaeria aponina SAG 52.96 = DSM 107014]|uniref:AAA family ATPase n=1 Tax=Gomphosphaeria aponina SAG 52.96 = DSM 107014 TaxID=1521640 RepID=A0A941GVE7_9CHRO|nr:AAA family ATPase [Gomphosphaeria aponina SAG 52.96 = DSM 107014]